MIALRHISRGFVVGLLIYAVAIGASYLLARTGEPSNLWLWRDVLNIIEG
jgi:CHASE3 domain sensor protein